MCERRREEAREGERRGRGKQRLGERRAALSDADGRTNDDSASKCGAAAPIIREKLQLTHAYRSGRLS